MCSSKKKYPYQPRERLTEILKGEGVSKAQFFLKKGMIMLNWNFRRGWGLKV